MSNREIDFGFGCVRACMRAKLCAGAKGTMVPPGARPKNWKFVGVCRALPGPPSRLMVQMLKQKVLFAAFSRIRVLSSSCRVFPWGFHPQKSSKFGVRLLSRLP